MDTRCKFFTVFVLSSLTVLQTNVKAQDILEKVLVTAQKTSQSLQDTPSMSVWTRNLIDEKYPPVTTIQVSGAPRMTGIDIAYEF